MAKRKVIVGKNTGKYYKIPILGKLIIFVFMVLITDALLTYWDSGYIFKNILILITKWGS